jgi:hypothetical protein
MASIFSIAGRLYGNLARSDAGRDTVRALEDARRAVMREAGVARVRVRIAILKRKRTVHLALLGKTVHRLITNEVDPGTHAQVDTIISVLGEIDREIAAEEGELAVRRGENTSGG